MMLTKLKTMNTMRQAVSTAIRVANLDMPATRGLNLPQIGGVWHMPQLQQATGILDIRRIATSEDEEDARILDKDSVDSGREQNQWDAARNERSQPDRDADRRRWQREEEHISWRRTPGKREDWGDWRTLGREDVNRDSWEDLDHPEARRPSRDPYDRRYGYDNRWDSERRWGQDSGDRRYDNDRRRDIDRGYERDSHWEADRRDNGRRDDYDRRGPSRRVDQRDERVTTWEDRRAGRWDPEQSRRWDDYSSQGRRSSPRRDSRDDQHVEREWDVRGQTYREVPSSRRQSHSSHSDGRAGRWEDRPGSWDSDTQNIEGRPIVREFEHKQVEPEISGNRWESEGGSSRRWEGDHHTGKKWEEDHPSNISRSQDSSSKLAKDALKVDQEGETQSFLDNKAKKIDTERSSTDEKKSESKWETKADSKWETKADSKWDSKQKK